LRDDLSVLFEYLTKYQNNKIDFLKDFLNKELEIKHILSGKIEDQLIDIINSENSIIEKIDICDYDIASNIDKIKIKTGVDLLKPGINNNFSNEKSIEEFINNKNLIDSLIIEISRLRQDNIKLMKLIAEETSRSGDELSRIDQIKKRFSKDLRSSWF